MRDESIVVVNCPTCAAKVRWLPESPYRPFCSKRCQLIDLGEWAAEEKRIPGNPEFTETESWSEQDPTER